MKKTSKLCPFGSGKNICVGITCATWVKRGDYLFPFQNGYAKHKGCAISVKTMKTWKRDQIR